MSTSHPPHHPHIKRHEPDDRAIDFGSLKKEALRYIRGLSGKVWTDYNLHDPGITILEQVCYALTELFYRSGFPMADYLTGPDGKIDFARQLLFPPDEVFPCHPVTDSDYRILLLDNFKQFENVWLRKAEDALPGLHDIFISLPGNDPRSKEETFRKRLERKVKTFCHRFRNLCEDVDRVVVMENEYYDLHAEIELEKPETALETLTRIYCDSAALLDPIIVFRNYEELLNQGESLEEIFTGPLTERGGVHGLRLPDEPEEIHISEVVRAIDNIPNVKGVRKLSLIDENGVGVETIPFKKSLEKAPSLSFPGTKGDIHVRLKIKDKWIKVRSRELFDNLAKRQSMYNARRYTRQDVKGLYDLPSGRRREMDAWFSIQDQFPAVYGINAYGVPTSEGPAARARARQLKAYLLLFEQFMANYMSTLKRIPDLFSADERLDRTCFHQVLDNSVAPDVNELYKGFRPGEKENPFEKRLEKIIRSHDDFHDRRNRFLDYLLAMHGEKFTQHSLGRFNLYYTEKEAGEILIRNKIHFLKNIVKINRDRGRSFNVSEPSWNTDDVSGLKLKSSILLGLPHHNNRSLTEVFLEHGMKIISDKEMEEMDFGSLELSFASLDRVEDRLKSNFHDVEIDPTEREVSAESIQTLKEEHIVLKNDAISESLLKWGLDVKRHRIGSFTEGKNYQAIFKPDGKTGWCYMSTHATLAEAAVSVNRLYRFIRMLNIESEGFHVVEHILLRPMFMKKNLNDREKDFFSLKVTVVFPSWTARFSDPDFRKLAEETIRLNCPAHVQPEFLWLAFDRMDEFEHLYSDWLILKSDPDEQGPGIDKQSEKIIHFLRKAKKAQKRK